MLEADMRALGIAVDGPPAEGLLEELAQKRGELNWMRALIIAEGERDPESLFRGPRSVKKVDDGQGNVVTTTEAGPGLSVKMQTYLQLGDRYRALVAVALAHGIHQRQIELAEREAETHGALVAAALDAAGVTGEQRVLALQAARERFTLIHGAA